MIKGLYAAASAMVANMKKQDTLSHNASNLETVGFKQILTSSDDYLYSETSYSPGNITDSNSIDHIGYLGLGTTTADEVTDFGTGAIKYTGNSTDFAINGDGFFRVQTPEGEERFTKDGRFLVNPDNQLVTATDGFYVLNAQGEKITLPDGALNVSEDGTIDNNGEVAGQIGLAVFSNLPEDVSRDGDNLFSAINQPEYTNVNNKIIQNSLETSNMNIAQLTTQILVVNRSYQAAARVVTNTDQLLTKTISMLGN